MLTAWGMKVVASYRSLLSPKMMLIVPSRFLAQVWDFLRSAITKKEMIEAYFNSIGRMIKRNCTIQLFDWFANLKLPIYVRFLLFSVDFGIIEPIKK